MVEKVKLGILDTCVCKNIYLKEKCMLKIEHFLLKVLPELWQVLALDEE